MGWSRAGYVIGATAGISIGTAVALTVGVVSGIVAGVVAAVAGGFAAGLEGKPTEFHRPDAAAGPGALLARDRGTGLLVLVIGGIAFGLGAGLGVRLVVGFAGGLTVGLVAASIQSAWLPFVVARWWFALRRRLPPGLMSFLDRAHRAGVLRSVGGYYQFRHVELQRRLARYGTGDRRTVREPDPE
jgi:hypothetical protein